MKLMYWILPSQISVGYCFITEIAALNYLPTLKYKKQKGKAAEV